MRRFEPLILSQCRVVEFDDAHLTERYVGWLNDPQVVRYSEQRHRHHDRTSCKAYRESMAAAGNLLLAIETAELGHVGNIGIAFDRPNRSADLSILIGEAPARGQGIATQAWCAVVEGLLEGGEVRRVTAGTMECNRPMIALMTKSGMTLEAVRPRAFLLDGREVGCVLGARFADDGLETETCR